MHWCAQSCCFSVLRWGSKVYGCLVDGSKAFDTVDHSILLKKLLSRGSPNVLVRFLLRWYQAQRLRTKWNGLTFSVLRGVRQGGVLPPILFTLYIDDLLKELSHSNVGCYWDNVFVGALAYAGDLTLLAPSPSALRKFLAICEKSGSELRLKSNPGKTQSIRFSGERLGGHGIAYQFCGKCIRCVEYVSDLQKNLDIQSCKCTMFSS